MEEWKSENLKPEDDPEVKGFEETNQEIPEKENTSNPVIEKNEKEITIKKSTYNNLLKALVITIGVAAFFSGYGVGIMDTNSSISNEEISLLLKEVQTKAIPAGQPAVPAAPSVIQVSLDDDPVKGNPDAPVTIIEFSDFQCPFCSRFFTQTLPLIEENYINSGKVKLVYRDLPLDSIHQNARPAHIAAECADEQGKFWEYHDILFINQKQWQGLSLAAADKTFKEYAGELGLQTASFDSCLESPIIAEEVNKDVVEATTYGATGTPSFFIGNEKDGFIKLSGAQPFTVFQSAIEDQLK